LGYVDPGATAFDSVALDLTFVILTDTSDVNAAVEGTYIVNYSVFDGFNTGVATRTVNVVDTTAPVISIDDPPAFIPPGPFTLDPGETHFTLGWPVDVVDLEAGLTITCDIGDPPDTISPESTTYDEGTGTLTANFNYGPPTYTGFTAGTTIVTCTVTDQAGNSTTSVPFEVFVEDHPTISADNLNLPVDTDADGGTTATVFEADLIANVTVSDQIDNVTDLTVSCLETDPSEFEIGSHEITCTVTDTAGNSASTTFDLVVDYLYEIVIEIPKGRKNAGDVIPVDIYYLDADGNRIDSSAFVMSASWIGPYADPNCTDNSLPTFGDGDGSSSGSSGWRYSVPKDEWQFSWLTPFDPVLDLSGGYKFSASPPGSSVAECMFTR
jgi:hypothetical protein